MTVIRRKYEKAEFARMGDAVFEQSIRSQLDAVDDDHFVAIDIESGDFEVDPDQRAASDRLRARIPTAQIWLRRKGSRYVRRFGASQRGVRP